MGIQYVIRANTPADAVQEIEDYLVSCMAAEEQKPRPNYRDIAVYDKVRLAIHYAKIVPKE